MLTVTAFELILSMNSCQTQSLGWYIFNQSRIRTWKTKYSKVLRYPHLSVTSNPYQGLKPHSSGDERIMRYVLSVTSNPYQGLKPVSSKIW